ncbi:Hachiman antiphage defense system protein HamA [Bradyrhizobium sp. SUTN9-2]|uniref:Hachiman antiphage defense system protein HamA n=1 Tax=Bradyrhizobium sp. SUTN9-2 TaxID=1167456 RepID=UPI000D6435FC|nr:Hachiman antiphage defense system protein HamA [Bradyrhizobium sp. SUTN9-2]
MSQLKAWCDPVDQKIKANRLTVLSADPAKRTVAIEALAKEVPNHYSSPKRVARLLKRLGKDKAAAYIEQKLPTAATSRSGDLGEILATLYVAEFTPFGVSINRLRWKDHREMAMRGEDIVAVQWDAAAGLRILKGESKSNASLSTATVTKARTALKHNNGRPTPHALSFLADRLHEQGKHDLGNEVDEVQLSKGIRRRFGTSHRGFERWIERADSWARLRAAWRSIGRSRPGSVGSLACDREREGQKYRLDVSWARRSILR